MAAHLFGSLLTGRTHTHTHNSGLVPKQRRRKRRWLHFEPLECRRLLAVIMVDSYEDNMVQDGSVTLREAIQAANNNESVDGSEAGESGVPDTINFDPSLAGATINLTYGDGPLGDMDITESLLIDAGNAGITIDATHPSNKTRIFNIMGNDTSLIAVELKGLTLTGGDAGGQAGGAIHSEEASLTVRDSRIVGNTSNRGGGIYATAQAVDDQPAEIRILNSIISGNSVSTPTGGGGAYISVNDSLVEIDNTLVSSNSGADGGGGLHVRVAGELPAPALLTDPEFRLTNSTIDGNTALFKGGGLYFKASGGADVEVSFSTISGNEATISGPSNKGGGVYGYSLSSPTPATATISNTTISDNQARTEGAGMFFCTKNDASLTIQNSTISGNRDGGGENRDLKGGGLYLASTYPGVPDPPALYARLTNVTITENTAGDGGGGLWTLPMDPNWVDVQLDNTIISGNTDGAENPNPSDIAGEDVLQTSSHNLIGSGGSGGLSGGTNGNIVGQDSPGLLPLADNGGPTMTHALVPGGPAIDKGHDNVPGGLAQYDQRGPGYNRKKGDEVDIGAYEFDTNDFPDSDYPVIVEVIVSNANGTHPPYSIPSGSGEQLATVPVGGANQITVLFNKPVNVLASHGELKGYAGETPTDYGHTLFAQRSPYVATWTFGDSLPADMMELTVKDLVTDLSNNHLDGDWVDNIGGTDYGNPASVFDDVSAEFPSGDGMEGGDFIFHFTILPGDANRDNVVGLADVAIMQHNYLPSEPYASFEFTDGDFDGDGILENVHDYTDRFRVHFTRVWTNWGFDYSLGDYELDEDVDFDDSNALVEILIDTVEVYAQNRGLPLDTVMAVGDIDEDGDIDFDEIDYFVEILKGNEQSLLPDELG